MPDTTAFRDKHVVVTGGSLGIGAAAAAEFAAAGGRVSIIARGETALRETADRIGAQWAAADVSDADAIATAIDTLEQRNGDCDVLFCCAGIVILGRLPQLSSVDMARQIEVNYLGTVYAVQAVLPAMVRRGSGRLAMTSSTAGLLGVVGLSGYCPTKAAIRSYAQTLRYELHKTGVTVSVLYPPDTNTPGLAAELTQRPPETSAMARTIAPMEPEIVARALLRGIARGKPHIAVDALTRFLVGWAGAPEALARPFLNRVIDRARNAAAPTPPLGGSGEV